MKSSTKLIMMRLIACLLIFSTLNLTMSCGKQENPIPVQSKADASEVAKDIFKAVIFGTGNFVDNIPAIRNMNRLSSLSTNQINEYFAVQENVLNYINENNASFWTDFYSKMSSKNSNQIKVAIKEAALITKEAIEQKYLLNLSSEIEKFQSLSEEEQDQILKTGKISSEAKKIIKGSVKKGINISDLDKDNLSSLIASASAYEEACVFEAVVLVAAGAIAVGLYIWMYVARWEAVTYPDDDEEKEEPLTNDEIAGQIGVYFQNL